MAKKKKKNDKKKAKKQAESESEEWKPINGKEIVENFFRL